MKALIQNENGLLINGDSYTTPDTIRIDNTAYSFMTGSNEDIIIGDTNSGYMTALNEDGDIDQSVDLPIQYDLGTELATFPEGYGAFVGCTVDTGGGLLDVTVTDSASYYFHQTITTVVGKTYQFTITTDSTDAQNLGYAIYDETNGEWIVPVSSTSPRGVGTLDIEFISTGEEIRIYPARSIIAEPAVSTSVVISVSSVKEVISTNSYATYYDVDTKAFKTIDNPTGTTYNMADSFSSYFTTDVPVTEGDRAKLNANPNLIYDLWFGSTITGLSFTKANVINFIPATEGLQGGAYLQDLNQLGTQEANSLTITKDLVASNENDDGYDLTVSAGLVSGTTIYTQTSLDTTTDNTPYAFSVTIECQTGDIYVKSVLSGDGSNNAITTTVDTDLSAGQSITIDITPAMYTRSTYSGGFRIHYEKDGSASLAGTATVRYSIKEVTAYEIANYTDTCRTFYIDEVYGFQNVLAEQDASGRITGIADLTTVDMIEPLRVRSPDGTVWIITVDDLGVVSAVEEV